MKTADSMAELLKEIAHAARVSDGELRIVDDGRFRAEAVDFLIWQAVFSPDEQTKQFARWMIWEASQELGCPSSSIHEFYLGRGRGEYHGFTVPAMNIRGLAYDAVRTAIRVAKRINAGAFIFELAKSEMGYTFQPPVEYATCVLAAALKEHYRGPVFIQGDHFQFNAKRHKEHPEKEAQGIRDLIKDAIAAGFYNIDIDSSTLVDLSFPTVDAQQRTNYQRAAEMTAHIRSLEPEGITISVGGEIGEVGGKNSTVEELTAYMEGYQNVLPTLRGANGLIGISKISVQTGTEHGGVPLPDGTVAKVELDFATLEKLSKVARERYGLAGAVQHGASTLPEQAFDRFSQVETAEVHLATGFQNCLMDSPHFPKELKQEINAWVAEECQADRKPGWTDEQFLYKTRKKAWGPFKLQMWSLPESTRLKLMAELEKMFDLIFTKLNIKDTHPLVTNTVKPVPSHRKFALA